jgi:Domain of unknown function (DUF4351)/Putative transposase, YhgA-like
MIDHDRLFKELLTTFFVEFVDLFFPDVAAYLDRDFITFLDKEIFTDVTEGDQFEADLVVKARFLDQEAYFLIHLEHQSYSQADFDYRMYRYFARFYEKFRLPIYPIVIFSFDEPLRPEPSSHQVAFPAFVVLQFNYRVVQLNRLHWRDYLQSPNPVASALMAKMQIAPEDRPQVKMECLRLMTTLRLDRARMKMISGFVDTYLKLNAAEEQVFLSEIAIIEPRESSEVVMQIVTSWMEQGEQREAAKLVLRQLNKQLASLSIELTERIQTLPTPILEDLSEALLSFRQLPDLTDWLGQHGLPPEE